MFFKVLFGFLMIVGFMVGCENIVIGTGVFRGKLIDVSWQGLAFKSCEITQQVGVKLDDSSSMSKKMCDALMDKLGQDVTIEYDTHLINLRTDTTYIIRRLK